MLDDEYRSRCKLLKENGLANEELNNYENFKEIMSKDEFKQCLNKKQNRKNKRYRCKQKYLEMLKIMNYRNRILGFEHVQMIFGTITLDDKNLLGTKENTYIRKIHAWLKEHCIYSVLNKDFGSRTEREHYHFVAITDNEIEPVMNSKGNQVTSRKGIPLYEFKRKTYKIGFEPTLELINVPNKDIMELVNYLLKLNNHSNKMTTKNRFRVIKNWKADFTLKALE